MKRIYITILIGFIYNAVVAQAPVLNLIPKPEKVVFKYGVLMPAKSIKAYINEKDTFLTRISKDFIKLLPSNPNSAYKETKLLIEIGKFQNLKDEGYSLFLYESAVIVKANSPAGIFYALQSLKQISKNHIEIPCVEIHDNPVFAWRGMMLDVSRHFYTKEEVKRYIDLLALHKMNKFHWHLTDDQGWRIEIKKYPLLTEKGAWREDRRNEPWTYFQYEPVPGKPKYGGFYTQEDIKEVVSYAAARFITVVPEIDMPGHSWSAIYAYPWLSCDGKIWRKPENIPFEFSDPLCVCKDSVITFAKDVLDEVITLFPSPYIHIGGDECKRSVWLNSTICGNLMASQKINSKIGLQNYFNKQLEEFINAKGRKLIGWDEILEEGTHSKKSLVMSWRGETGGIEAANEGHEVVMSPSSHCYFDAPNEPVQGFNYNAISLEKVYSYNPVPKQILPLNKKFIIGVQANLWTEKIQNIEQADKMLLPRLSALSEVAWTKPENKNYEQFYQRLLNFLPLLEQENYKIFIPAPGGVEDNQLFVDKFVVNLTNPMPGTSIYYTLDGTEPTVNSQLYKTPFELNKSAQLKATIFLKNGESGKLLDANIVQTKYTEAPANLKLKGNGLKVKYYEGTFTSVNQIENLTPLKETTIATFSIPGFVRKDYWGISFSGGIKIDADGVYTFSLESDDGSSLIVDNTEIINNDGIHGKFEKKGIIALKKGIHTITVKYFEGNYGEYLSLKWKNQFQNKPISIDPKNLFIVE